MAFNFAFMIFFVCFLPFIVSLFGRDSRWKGLAVALCIASLLAGPSSDNLAAVFWFGAWVSAILAIAAWFRPRVDRRPYE